MAFYEFEAVKQKTEGKSPEAFANAIGPNTINQLARHGVPLDLIELMKPHVMAVSDGNLEIANIHKNKLPGHVLVQNSDKFKDLMYAVMLNCNTVQHVGLYGFKYSTIRINNQEDEILASTSHRFREAMTYAFVIECTKNFGKPFRFSILIKRDIGDWKLSYMDDKLIAEINSITKACIKPYLKDKLSPTEGLDEFILLCRRGEA